MPTAAKKSAAAKPAAKNTTKPATKRVRRSKTQIALDAYNKAKASTDRKEKIYKKLSAECETAKEAYEAAKAQSDWMGSNPAISDLIAAQETSAAMLVNETVEVVEQPTPETEESPIAAEQVEQPAPEAGEPVQDPTDFEDEDEDLPDSSTVAF